jgi:hypothetical protein
MDFIQVIICPFSQKWHKKTDLLGKVGISPITLTKFAKNEQISGETIEKLCFYFKAYNHFQHRKHRTDTPKDRIKPSSFRQLVGCLFSKTIEVWENGRNKPEGISRCLLEVVWDAPSF